MNNKTIKHLKKLVPRNAKGDQLDFSNEDFTKFSESIEIAKKRTNMIALELVLDITLRDALAAAYLQGMNDKVISEVNQDK